MDEWFLYLTDNSSVGQIVPSSPEREVESSIKEAEDKLLVDLVIPNTEATGDIVCPDVAKEAPCNTITSQAQGMDLMSSKSEYTEEGVTESPELQ